MLIRAILPQGTRPPAAPPRVRRRPAAAGLGAAAVVVPAAAGITLAAVLEAILFVLSAIAAAYLLIKAYEFAKSRGFGVSLAQKALSAGLGRLLSGARRLVDVLRRILARARGGGRGGDPRCAAAIAALARLLARIETALRLLEAEVTAPVPRIHVIRALMDQLKSLASSARPIVQAIFRYCL